MGLFNTGKPESRLARLISITSPEDFKQSVKVLKKGGLTFKEKMSLVLAQNRAKAQLGRKNLSDKERKEMRAISKIKI